MSALLPASTLGTPAGERTLARLAARGALVLDRRLVRQAEALVERVRREGDAALLEAALRHDSATATTAAGLALGPPLLAAERPHVSAAFAAALEEAITRVTRFHEPQVVPGYRLAEGGVELVERRQGLARVGVYVPGGRAVYPSTVVMTVIPAQLAGVGEIAVATPPAAFREHAALRYTLARLGIREVWGMGGAQAVAALAYGTASVRRVDKIVGPGNAWVTAAKRKVAGVVAIDGIAGPSEVVVVADVGANPGTLAADLLAQAEHDPRAAAVLISFSRPLVAAVRRELEFQLAELSTAETARASLQAYGRAFVAPGEEEALAAIEALAPEHLQLVGPRAEALVEGVRSAGAIFVGGDSAEVFGDYLAGPSHVLPTCGTARFASALGVEDFVRRSHVVRLERGAAARLAGHVITLAEAEGLPAHARAAARRLA